MGCVPESLHSAMKCPKTVGLGARKCLLILDLKGVVSYFVKSRMRGTWRQEGSCGSSPGKIVVRVIGCLATAGGADHGPQRELARRGQSSPIDRRPRAPTSGT